MVREIFFVGAGPGDPELLTLKGKRILEGADCVLYAGSLVNPVVLEFCGPACLKVDSAPLSLEEQITLMVTESRRGHRVVRLHTGDPSLYGAVGEQVRALETQGISVVFVPGVSSLQGVAASLGVEYTVPGGTQTVICTRRSGKTPVRREESLEKLAASGATLVIFLSADQIENVVQDCLKGGLSVDTPAACVYRASWPDERVLRSTLGNLAALMAAENIVRHALLVVGSCLEPGDARSFLYDRSFAHGFRPVLEKGDPQ